MSHTRREESERSRHPRLGYLRSTAQRREQHAVRYIYEDEDEDDQLGGREPQPDQLGEAD